MLDFVVNRQNAICKIAHSVEYVWGLLTKVAKCDTM